VRSGSIQPRRQEERRSSPPAWRTARPPARRPTSWPTRMEYPGEEGVKAVVAWGGVPWRLHRPRRSWWRPWSLRPRKGSSASMRRWACRSRAALGRTSSRAASGSSCPAPAIVAADVKPQGKAGDQRGAGGQHAARLFSPHWNAWSLAMADQGVMERLVVLGLRLRRRDVAHEPQHRLAADDAVGEDPCERPAFDRVHDPSSHE